MIEKWDNPTARHGIFTVCARGEYCADTKDTNCLQELLPSHHLTPQTQLRIGYDRQAEILRRCNSVQRNVALRQSFRGKDVVETLERGSAAFGYWSRS